MDPNLKRRLAQYAQREFLEWDSEELSTDQFRKLCREGLPGADLAEMEVAFASKMLERPRTNSSLYFGGREMPVKDWAIELGWNPAELVRRLMSLPIRQALTRRPDPC